MTNRQKPTLTEEDSHSNGSSNLFGSFPSNIIAGSPAPSVAGQANINRDNKGIFIVDRIKFMDNISLRFAYILRNYTTCVGNPTSK